MKLISASERCGVEGLVFAGRVLLGVPGAPGWTMGAEFDCVGCAANEALPVALQVKIYIQAERLRAPTFFT